MPMALPLSSCSRQTKPSICSASAFTRATLSTNSAMRGSSSGYLTRATLNWARWRGAALHFDMRMLPAPVGFLDDGPFLLGRDRRRGVPAALTARGMLAQMLERQAVRYRPPEAAVATAQIFV